MIYLDSNQYAHLIETNGPPEKRFTVTPLNDEIEPCDTWMLGPWQCLGQAIEAVDLRYV